MARTPRRVASATGDDQSQPVQTGPATSTPSDSAAASGDEASDGEGDSSEAQSDSSPPAADSAETSAPAPAPVDETPADTSDESISSPEPENGTAADAASAPVEDNIEVRVLVAYDDYLPNDVIVMDRVEAAIRLEQVDADPVAVAYAKGLLA